MEFKIEKERMLNKDEIPNREVVNNLLGKEGMRRLVACKVKPKK